MHKIKKHGDLLLIDNNVNNYVENWPTLKCTWLKSKDLFGLDTVFWWQIEKRYCFPFISFLRNFAILKTIFVPFKSFLVAWVLMMLFIRVTHPDWIEKGYRRQICCNFHFPPKLYWSYSTLQYVAILPIEKLSFSFQAKYLGVHYLSNFTFIV